MITSTEPQVAINGRYSIKDTCKALSISRETLRRYTYEGHIKCGFRRNTARKFYLGSEILRFWKAQI